VEELNMEIEDVKILLTRTDMFPLKLLSKIPSGELSSIIF
jgi:hypothetical protein